MKEQYRFENGHLYAFDADSNAYIHCYHNARVKTEARAIAAYEDTRLSEMEG